MAQLSQLLEADRKPALVGDVAAFVEDNISQQSGLTGMAIKGAVGAAKKIDAQIVSKGMNRLLPDIIADLEPQWAEFEASEQSDFGAFLEPKAAQVTDSIMKTADKHAESISVPALQKAYNSLRAKGAKIIEPQVPALARILQNHM